MVAEIFGLRSWCLGGAGRPITCQSERKGRAVSSPPQAVATSLLVEEDMRIFAVGDQFVLLTPTETEKPSSDTVAEA